MSKEKSIFSKSFTDASSETEKGSMNHHESKEHKHHEKHEHDNHQQHEHTHEHKNHKNEESEAKMQELKDSIVRLYAEIENLKKRHNKDIESATKYGSTALLKDLTEPFEQLFMALSSKVEESVAASASVKSVLDGIQMTKQTFEKAFAKHGLVRIYPKGEKFDHDKHQAVSQIKQDGTPSGIVLEVVQAGYILNDRVIKPAIVVVTA